jgi:hypothetical protein
LKIRSSPPARRPSEEESQRPAGQQADREDHGEEGDYSAAQSLKNSRRHQVVGGDEQQLMGQHADSMAGRIVIIGGRTAVSAMPLAPLVCLLELLSYQHLVDADLAVPRHPLGWMSGYVDRRQARLIGVVS